MPKFLAKPMNLPCGATIPNRLAKAAMTEGLATGRGVATPELERLYGLWSDGGVDLIEISGGTYEQPKLLGLAGVEPEEQQHIAQSTLMREAYFVDFALAMQDAVSIPLMVTGGFRTRSAMEQAFERGAADLIGIGRPLCVDTDAPARLLAGAQQLERYEDRLALLPDGFSRWGGACVRGCFYPSRSESAPARVWR